MTRSTGVGISTPTGRLFSRKLQFDAAVCVWGSLDYQLDFDAQLADLDNGRYLR